jgi:hypothetical protein
MRISLPSTNSGDLREATDGLPSVLYLLKI